MVGDLDDFFRALSDGVRWTDIPLSLPFSPSFYDFFIYPFSYAVSHSPFIFSLRNPLLIPHFLIHHTLAHFLTALTLSPRLSISYLHTNPPRPIHTHSTSHPPTPPYQPFLPSLNPATPSSHLISSSALG